MNKYIVIITYLLMFLWSVASLQMSIDIVESTSDNSTYGYISLVCLLLIEFLSVFVLLLNIKNLRLTKLSGFVLVWLLYVVINTLLNSDDLFRDLREAIWWPLVYFLFYFITVNDSTGRYVELLLNFFKVLFFVVLIQYLFLRSMTAVYYSIGGKQMYGSSNQIFYVALLLPFAFLFKNRRLKYSILLIGLIAVLISFKRSAIIYTPLIFLVAIYFDFLKGRKNSFVKSFFFATVFLSISLFAYDYIDNLTGGHISKRFENIEDDKGSGRLDVYTEVLNAFEKKPYINKILGSGHNSVRKEAVVWEKGNTVPLSAHNDFIEIIYDFGYLGFLFYLLITYRIIKLGLKIKKIDSGYFHANVAVLIIFIVMSMVSHLVIYATYYAYLVIIWAITEGQISGLTKRYNMLKKYNGR